MLVNDTLVRKYFMPTDDPIGQRLNFDRPGGTGPWRTIIGVVRDFREELVDQDPNPTIYEAIALNTDLMFTIVMRTTMDATTLAPTVRAIIHDLDPNLPVTAVQPLTARVDEALAPQRFVTMLMALFAMTGVALATVGLLRRAVLLAAQRTHEIGVRIALGASGSDVVRLVTRQALRVDGDRDERRCRAGAADGTLDVRLCCSA